MEITMSPLVLTALEAQEGSRAGKCFSLPCTSTAYFNLQPRTAEGSLFCNWLFVWELDYKAA